MKSTALKNINNKAELLRVIGHPVRLRILKGICEHECNVSKMQKELNIPQPTVSTHLALLRNTGIIEGKRNGLEVCYLIKDEWVKKVLKLVDQL
jgi:DNA-binding transcriptional ArsR family regulator